MMDSWGRDVCGCKLDKLVPPLPSPSPSVSNQISRVSDCFPLNNQLLTVTHYSDVCEIWLCPSDQNMEHQVWRLVHPEEERFISVSLPFSLISTMRKLSRSFIIACCCRDTCPISFVTTWLHFYLETLFSLWSKNTTHRSLFPWRLSLWKKCSCSWSLWNEMPKLWEMRIWLFISVILTFYLEILTFLSHYFEFYHIIVICYLIISAFNLKSRFLSYNFDDLSYDYDFYLMGLLYHKHPFQMKAPFCSHFFSGWEK